MPRYQFQFRDSNNNVHKTDGTFSSILKAAMYADTMERMLGHCVQISVVRYEDVSIA